MALFYFNRKILWRFLFRTLHICIYSYVRGGDLHFRAGSTEDFADVFGGCPRERSVHVAGAPPSLRSIFALTLGEAELTISNPGSNRSAAAATRSRGHYGRRSWISVSNSFCVIREFHYSASKRIRGSARRPWQCSSLPPRNGEKQQQHLLLLQYEYRKANKFEMKCPSFARWNDGDDAAPHCARHHRCTVPGRYVTRRVLLYARRNVLKTEASRILAHPHGI